MRPATIPSAGAFARVLRDTSVVLVVVQARFRVDWSRREWIEDELVRGGARDARLIDDELASVTVCANSREAAADLVLGLLGRLGAKAVEVVAPEIELV
jgi:hypothetical protein